jgi:hypothetical protein
MSYTDRDIYGMYKDPRHIGPGPGLMGAGTLIGDSVVNAAEEDLGEIKEIMLDMQTGQVAYAVLAFGGILGMGEKLFAVPWQALHLDTENKRMVLNVEREKLSNAPGFIKDAWPDMTDLGWSDSIHDFYGTDREKKGGPSMGPGSGNGGANRAVSAGSSSAASDSHGVGGSVDPRPGHDGDDSDVSRVRGSNIG